MAGVGNRKFLWVLRHAKAADPTPDVLDRDRALTVRGRADAKALGDRLTAEIPRALLPTFVLCSTAARAMETADVVVACLPAANRPRVRRSGALYETDAEGALQQVREVDDRYQSALLVGHNPSLAELAWSLIDPDPPWDDDLAHGPDQDRARGRHWQRGWRRLVGRGRGLTQDLDREPGADHGSPEGRDGSGANGRALLARTGLATCGLVVLEIPVPSWGQVRWGTGTLVELLTPPY